MQGACWSGIRGTNNRCARLVVVYRMYGVNIRIMWERVEKNNRH